jgi:hypothetical protein
MGFARRPVLPGWRIQSSRLYFLEFPDKQIKFVRLRRTRAFVFHPAQEDLKILLNQLASLPDFNA